MNDALYAIKENCKESLLIHLLRKKVNLNNLELFLNILLICGIFKKDLMEDH